MNILTLAFLVLCLSSVAYCQSGPYTWTPVRTNIGQICPGLDFYSNTSGWILDFVSGPGPILLHTVDGGATLTSALSAVDILIMENIVSSSNGQYAVTAGVSLANEAVSIQTSDNGASWAKSGTTVLQSVFNGLQVLPPSNDIALFGSWTTRNPSGKGVVSGAGIAYSTNQGGSYQFFNWPYPDVTPVAGNYLPGSFASVVLVGSAAPYVADDDSQAVPHRALLSKHREGLQPVQRASDFPANETYRAYVALSTNSGTTWSTIYSFEGLDNVTGISLGGGYFQSATTGFVCGMNHTAAGSAAFLMGTTDGGANWVTLIQLPGGVFTRVECISATQCFVIGGAPGGVLGNGVVYQTTDGGKTWGQTLVPKIAAFTDLSVVNANTIYATAVTAFQTCDLYYWGPPQQSTSAQA